MINFLYKIAVFSMVLYYLTNHFPKKIYFPSKKSLLSLTGLFIAVGLIADETVLPRFGNLKSTLQGSIFMAVVSWLSQFFRYGNRITCQGALLIGATLGICELPMHRWILMQRKMQP